MAQMESITGLDRKVRRHFKKVLSRLSDDFIVREPLLDESKIAPIVLEGPCKSWLMIGWHEKQPNENELAKWRRFNSDLLAKGYQPIKYLAVVEEDLGYKAISEEQADRFIHILGQKSFYIDGEKNIVDLLTESPLEQYYWVKKTLFPESAIHSQCTTRRSVSRVDNTASLQQFFLDYDQELATRFDMLEQADVSEESQDDFSVRLINGVAGSGKTLILINRAIAFCKKHPDKKALLVIHNKPVTSDIKHRFEEWLGGAPSNLKIETFHQFALNQQKKVSNNWRLTPLFGDKAVEPLRAQIFCDTNESYTQLKLTDGQIWSELEYINEYLIKDEDDYLEYERQGRGFALQKSQRLHIWKLYEMVVQTMSSPKGYLPSLYVKDLALREDSNGLEKFDHILVDEAQFFAPSWLQLVKMSLISNGAIFLCADPNQGFLKSRLSWKSVGFNVRGRTKRLNYSYRTTYEIMVAANALIEGIEDDADDFVKPDLQRMERGVKPQIIYSHTLQDEKIRFLNELSECCRTDDIPLQQVMVLCSGSYSPWSLKRDIENTLGKGTVVNCNDWKDIKDNIGGKIRLMSINSCTGMESGVTFVLGAGELMNQAKNIDLDDAERELAQKESLRKLYVSMTRAGQRLALFSTEKLPDRINEHVELSGASLD
ncbi:AAA family ATPase [Vibrio coralliilyticus]|uniref:UvrD-helicase domain-containing protein n=1 Tax=Vibrio coralliilyticus TaxID=190893 RepID=UPI000BAC1D7F|nr:UvrD-helicase domain-containing protein [Vibrio coralliilyticus]NOI77506.1 AAA family ATPase [Vibrio coralliilyticus]PAW02551.1 DNA helicase [Vibrio coralliilyticus]